MLQTLTTHVVNSQQMTDIELEIEQLTEDAKTVIENKRDLSKINADFIS